MKRQIRRDCFETNSSSSHSIVVVKNRDEHITKEDFANYPERVYVGKNGVWEIAWNPNDLDFGRGPFQFLSTFESKFRYAVAEFGLTHELIGIALKIVPNVIGVELPTIDRPIFVDKDGNEYSDKIHYDDEKDEIYTDKDGVRITLERDFKFAPYSGYIDHQSMGKLTSFLRKQDISLEEFLTNRKYTVVIDGDEYDEFGMAKYSGLISEDNIEAEF